MSKKRHLGNFFKEPSEIDDQTDPTLAPSSWDGAARRIFSKLYGRSVDTTLREAAPIEFDGVSPVLGKTIEAWAISKLSGEHGGDYDAAKMIIDGYFFARYPAIDMEPELEQGKRERGFNLNSKVYYSVRITHARNIDPKTGEPQVVDVRVFRDYDRSPKTFSYRADGTEEPRSN